MSAYTQEDCLANDDRLDPRELDDIERLAKDGLHGGLLEQGWSRRALALVREVRMLRERLAAIEDQDSKPAGSIWPLAPRRRARLKCFGSGQFGFRR